jgi:hypothetical protein
VSSLELSGLSADGVTRLKSSGHDIVETWEEMLTRGWGDGLPVIPPTPQRVARMLAGRDPDAAGPSIGAGDVFIGREAQPAASYAQIAANAVLAGCDPSYFPVVLAGLQAIAAAGGAAMFTNSPAAPLFVVNGPIRDALDINSSHEMLSLTTRANATIGRAVRLTMMNTLDARPPRLFDVQHGMPGRLSMVFAEAEEESPWEPLSVTQGQPLGASALTLFPAFGTMPVNYHQVPQRASEVLLILQRCLDYVRGNRIGPSPDSGAPVVVLSPKHVRAFSLQGWTKQSLEDELTAAVNDHYEIELASHQDKIELINRGRDPADAPVIPGKPEGRVSVVIAGGVAGWHSLLIPTSSWSGPVTVPIDA